MFLLAGERREKKKTCPIETETARSSIKTVCSRSLYEFMPLKNLALFTRTICNLIGNLICEMHITEERMQIELYDWLFQDTKD